MRNEKNRRPDTVTEEAELERVSGGMKIIVNPDLQCPKCGERMKALAYPAHFLRVHAKEKR